LRVTSVKYLFELLCTLAVGGTILVSTGLCSGAVKDDELFAAYAKKFVLVDGKHVDVPDKIKPGGAGKVVASDLAVGDFGGLEDAKILQVLGPDAMLVSLKYTTTSISFTGVRARQSFSSQTKVIMLKGFATRDRADGEDMDGERVAVVGTTSYKTVLGVVRTVLLAVPLKKVETGLSKEEFTAMLKLPGIRAKLEARFREEAEAEARRKRVLKEREESRRRALARAEERARTARAKDEKERGEKLADANLQYVGRLLTRGEVDKAKKRLQEIIKEFPGTKAAIQAAKQLRQMDEKP
jgi:hypothetical protein